MCSDHLVGCFGIRLPTVSSTCPWVCYVRMRAVPGVRLISEAGFVGLLLSLTCEFYQVFSPVRFPTMTDVLMNTIGASAGATIAAKSLARLRTPHGDELLS